MAKMKNKNRKLKKKHETVKKKTDEK